MRINRVKMVMEMARRDMKVKDLVEKSGVSKVTITAVKSGKSCSPATAMKLAAVLGENIIEKE